MAEIRVILVIGCCLWSPVCSCLQGIARNPQAVAECLAMVTETIKDRGSYYMMCCEDQDGKDGQMVGVLGMSKVAVGYKPSKETKAETKELQTLSKLLGAISLNKIMNELRVENFYSRGLVVHPEYRQFGIATQFLKARYQGCVEHNVPATGALITSVTTQKIAENEGWETVQKVDLGELGRQLGVTLDGVAKLMIWKNPNLHKSVCK